jgi:hypothetical protein
MRIWMVNCQKKEENPALSEITTHVPKKLVHLKF